MTSDLPPIILLSSAIIDRHARLVIEWDEEVAGRIVVDNGVNKYWYEGEDAQTIWNFYRTPEGYLS